MSNLLPPQAQKNMRAQFRARFLLAGAAVVLCCALLFALALVPAEVAIVSFASPAQSAAAQTSGNAAQDKTALLQTQGLLSALASLDATSSLSALSDALAARGQGVTIDAMSYSPAQGSLSLSGNAGTPDEVNSFREALQGSSEFSRVSVPVSALLGAQNGAFTITMNVVN